MADKNTMTCDLVVLGAGGGGLLAAVKAKDMGVKNVVILEKAKKPGGCTWYSGASPRPENATDEQKDARFREVMKELWWRVDPKLIRNAMYASAPCFEWFASICDVSDRFPNQNLAPGASGTRIFGKMGEPSAEEMGGQQGAPPQGTQGGGPQGTPGGQAGAAQGGQGGGPPGGGGQGRHINKKSRDPSIGPGSGGSYFVSKLLDKCKDLGIPVLTETRASEFVLDGKGVLTRVKAETPDGRITVDCKACVVATGGFGANIEKLKKRWPYHFNGKRIHRFTCPTDTGDAIDMAEKAGIYVDWENMNIQVGGPAHHPYSYSIYRVMWQPEVVYVNLNGERWIDETESLIGSYFCLGEQPRGEMWTIVDDSLLDTLGARLMERAGERYLFEGLRDDIAYEVSLDESGVGGKHSRMADTLEGLAKKIGADPKTFVKTIETYNRYCENGRDLDFAKKPEYLIPIRKPPFYAFWGQRFAETTHGGPVINENMAVLKEKGGTEVVPGLFCAGDASGGWNIDKPMPAISAGNWMVSSGYLAGVNAAKYLGKG